MLCTNVLYNSACCFCAQPAVGYVQLASRSMFFLRYAIVTAWNADTFTFVKQHIFILNWFPVMIPWASDHYQSCVAAPFTVRTLPLLNTSPDIASLDLPTHPHNFFWVEPRREETSMWNSTTRVCLSENNLSFLEIKNSDLHWLIKFPIVKIFSLQRLLTQMVLVLQWTYAYVNVLDVLP